MMTIHNPKVVSDSDLKTLVSCDAKIITVIAGHEGADIRMVNTSGEIQNIYLRPGETLSVVE